VSQFFEELAILTESNAEITSKNQSHAYFNSHLKKWHGMLTDLLARNVTDSEIMESIEPDNDEHTAENAIHHDNVFVHLYGDLDGSDDEGGGESTIDESAKAAIISDDKEMVSIEDDYFMEDLRLICLSFLYDAQTLLNDVEKIWDRVKKQEITVLAAAAFTCTALKKISSLFAVVTIHYPDISSFEDFFTASLNAMNRGDELATQRLLQQSELQASMGAKGFTVLSDMRNVMSCLQSFTSAYQIEGTRKTLILRRGYFGNPYDENTSPVGVAGVREQGQVFADTLRFMMQEIPYMYNDYIHYLQKDIDRHPMQHCPQLKFLTQGFFQMFETKHISMDAVMCGICWMKSVVSMQGDYFIGRTNYLLRESMRAFSARGKQCLSKGIIQMADRKLSDYVCDARVTMVDYWLDTGYFAYLFRNPLFSSACFLDLLMCNVHLSELVLTGTSSHYRAACHMYNALRLNDLIERIPLLESLISLFEDSLFTPSRPTSIRHVSGNAGFYNTFLLSSHLTADTVHSLDTDRKPHRRENRVKSRKKFDILASRSKILGTMARADYCDDKLNGNDFVELFNSEFFITKLANMDLLPLNGIFYDLFVTLRDTLGRNDAYNFIMETEFPDQSYSYRHTMALEMCTSYEVLKLLDVWTEKNRAGRSMEVPSVLRRAATIISTSLSQFDDSSASLCYCPIISPQSLYSGTFGEKAAGMGEHELSADEEEDVMACFCHIMDTLEDATSPLSNQDIIEMRELIRNTPDVLVKCSPTEELESIFHHFIGNPLHVNSTMIEWMCLLGGGTYSYMTVPEHLCVTRENEFGLRLLLRNTEGLLSTNPRNGDTLMHLAARKGNQSIITLLNRYNGRVDVPNKAGRTPIQDAMNAEIRKKLKRLEITQQSERERTSETLSQREENMINSIERNSHAASVRAEELQRKLMARREKGRMQGTKPANRALDPNAVRQAQQAEAELMSLLDAEEKQNRKPSGGGGGGGSNKKKKGKKK
jgi:hypothetical protein